MCIAYFVVIDKNKLPLPHVALKRKMCKLESRYLQSIKVKLPIILNSWFTTRNRKPVLHDVYIKLTGQISSLSSGPTDLTDCSFFVK